MSTFRWVVCVIFFPLYLPSSPPPLLHCSYFAACEKGKTGRREGKRELTYFTLGACASQLALYSFPLFHPSFWFRIVDRSMGVLRSLYSVSPRFLLLAAQGEGQLFL